MYTIFNLLFSKFVNCCDKARGKAKCGCPPTFVNLQPIPIASTNCAPRYKPSTSTWLFGTRFPTGFGKIGPHKTRGGRSGNNCNGIAKGGGGKPWTVRPFGHRTFG